MRTEAEPSGADHGVDAAMRALDRRGFLPREQRRWARQDRPLGIGYGQTSSQPSTVAAMLRLLEVPRGARVLDVGAGSGWTTALLARLVGPGGVVVGIERIPELASWGAANLAAAEMPWATLEPAPPGVLGRPGETWDRILVSAAADELPVALVDQLAAGGRLVAPVRHTMLLVERSASGADVRTTEHGSYTFVPLVEDRPDDAATR